MNILHIVGARPNFMKAAPVIRALEADRHRQTLVHTGQHYDFDMSDVFFRELGLPPADLNLEVGSGSHARQTAEVMLRMEPVLLERPPDLVMVYGDVNSTLAAALVCSKLGVRVAHVEAGLRSFDRTMPEEINRVLTDQVSDFLFTHSQEAGDNLQREGIAAGKVHLVGNVMIDTLVQLLPKASGCVPSGLPDRYVLVTLHRPGNVDDPIFISQIFSVLNEFSRRIPVIFPMHPRTRQRILREQIPSSLNGSFYLLDPLPYLSFLALQRRAFLVVTDSGGVQEETTFLGIPCLTVRENTERPVTVTLGTNTVVGRNTSRLVAEMEKVLSGQQKQGQTPPLWDGHAAQRIAIVLR